MAPSILQTLGKDRIIFVTKEDHETPSNAELVADDPNDPYEEHGERGAGAGGRQSDVLAMAGCPPQPPPLPGHECVSLGWEGPCADPAIRPHLGVASEL